MGRMKSNVKRRTISSDYYHNTNHGYKKFNTKEREEEQCDPDRKTVLARTMLYLEHKRRMLEPQQRIL